MDALDLWRTEIASGFRGQRAAAPSTWLFDALWRAACAVAFAREADGLGLQRTAAARRRLSSELIVAAKQTHSRRHSTGNRHPLSDAKS